jgi:hypothetical protein
LTFLAAARDWHFVAADHQCNTTDIPELPPPAREPKVVR